MDIHMHMKIGKETLSAIFANHSDPELGWGYICRCHFVSVIEMRAPSLHLEHDNQLAAKGAMPDATIPIQGTFRIPTN